jgi:hypothetical protein
MAFLKLISKLTGASIKIENVTNINEEIEYYKYTYYRKNSIGIIETCTGEFNENIEGMLVDESTEICQLYNTKNKDKLTDDELMAFSKLDKGRTYVSDIDHDSIYSDSIKAFDFDTDKEVKDKTFLCNPDKKIFTEEDSNDKLKKWMLSIVNNLPDAEVCRMAICTELAVKLASIRIEKYNASKEDIANKLCVKKKMIDKYESGYYNFTIKELVNIADKLDLDLDISLK